MRTALIIVAMTAGVASADPEITSKYPSGASRERVQMTNGKREGVYEKWASNCQIVTRGHYKLGQKDGDWADWTEKGRKRDEGSYADDLRHGNWTFYNAEGGKETSGPFVHGIAEGTFTEYFASGGKWRDFEMKHGERTSPDAVACKAKNGEWSIDYEHAEEGCRIEGQQQGIFTAYYPTNGKVRSRMSYVDGQLEGHGEELHPTGEILHAGTWKAGIPDGRHEWRSPTGVLYGASTITNGTGTWKAYLPDGKLSLDAAYKVGIPDGQWTAYYDNAAPWEQLTYVEGGATGPYKRWYKTGELAMAGDQVNGVRIGTWVASYQNGKKQWAGAYRDGMRVGVWSVWAWSGQLVQMGMMVDDKQNGGWIELHDNGHLKSIGSMQFGVKVGPWAEFWADGSFWRTVEYNAGMEAGPAPLTCARIGGNWFGDPEKRMLGCQVCRAKPDDTIDKIETGVWTWWHPNGKIEKRGGVDNGKQVGHWEFFFDNGAPMLEGDYLAGKEEGPWKGYYRGGTKRFEGSYTDGEPSGEWTSWQPSGSPLSKGNYTAGKRTGSWVFYNASGGTETVNY